MTIVSRLQLDHPALGTAGGAGLHTSVENLYKKLGDNIADRFFTITGLADTANTDLEHNYKTAFDDLRIDLYLWNTGTGELTQINDTSTPAISQFTIAATPGFLTSKVRVTNNSGAPRDLAVVMLHDPINLGELENVTLTSPANTDVLTFNSGLGKWVNGNPTVLAKNFYNKFIGPSETYTTIAAAMAAAAAGDRFLITGNVTETAAITPGFDNLVIDQVPSAVVDMNLAGKIVNDVRVGTRMSLSLTWQNTAAAVTDLLTLGSECRYDLGIVAANADATAITNLIGAYGSGTVANVTYKDFNTVVTNPTALAITSIGKVDAIIF